MLKVIASPQKIAEIINNFNCQYHRGFDVVKSLSARYFINGENGFELEMELALELSNVLKQWGAGGRKAPCLKSIEEIRLFLAQQDVKKLILKLSNNAEPMSCSVVNQSELIQLLKLFHDGLFLDNTNATYPTKAAMLLTGAFLGLDSQVRDGLKKIGISGFGNTQNLITDKKVIESIKWLYKELSDCWKSQSSLIIEGAELSNHSCIINQHKSPARVFDILFFSGEQVFSYAPT